MNIIFDFFNLAVSFLHSFIDDWGIVIILLTLMVKIILLPLTIKQRKVSKKQKVLSEQLKKIEEKFKGDTKKIEEEKKKISLDMAKNSVGCLLTLVQIPIIFSLYRFFSNMNLEFASILVPWVDNLSLSDNYYIIPIIAVVIQLIPNLQILNNDFEINKTAGISKFQMIMMGCVSFIFLLKAPVAIGIYWSASGIFSIIEKFIYNKLDETRV